MSLVPVSMLRTVRYRYDFIDNNSWIPYMCLMHHLITFTFISVEFSALASVLVTPVTFGGWASSNGHNFSYKPVSNPQAGFCHLNAILAEVMLITISNK